MLTQIFVRHLVRLRAHYIDSVIYYVRILRYIHRANKNQIFLYHTKQEICLKIYKNILISVATCVSKEHEILLHGQV